MANKRPQITLDDSTWQRLNALVSKTAHLDVNSVLRDCISRGLNAVEAEAYSSENKQLVNQKLKQRQGSMTQALETLKEFIDGDADGAEAVDAISILEKGLSD